LLDNSFTNIIYGGELLFFIEQLRILDNGNISKLTMNQYNDIRIINIKLQEEKKRIKLNYFLINHSFYIKLFGIKILTFCFYIFSPFFEKETAKFNITVKAFDNILVGNVTVLCLKLS
jgi:hypothetical protein